MNDRKDARVERRRHVRIAPKGTVVVHAGEHVQRGRIANLGEGGMLVTTTVQAPDRSLGGTVDLELRFDGPDAHWLRGTGQISRITAGAMAIVFADVSPQLRGEIAEMSASSRAHFRVMNIVLVDEDAARRARMVMAFRAAGCVVIETSTPLEAIVRLGESSFEPDLIAIADSIRSATADDLRTFVQREHPRTKLVAIGDDILEPAGGGHWLSSANDDLRSRVFEMLGRPLRPPGN